MMYTLLRQLCRMPLTPLEVEKFLYRAAKLAVIGEITGYDWKYLSLLVLYRINKYVLNK